MSLAVSPAPGSTTTRGRRVVGAGPGGTWRTTGGGAVAARGGVVARRGRRAPGLGRARRAGGRGRAARRRHRQRDGDRDQRRGRDGDREVAAPHAGLGAPKTRRRERVKVIRVTSGSTRNSLRRRPMATALSRAPSA